MSQFGRVSEIVQRAVDELVAAGADREKIERHMEAVEFSAVNTIAENSKDQLLLNFDYKTADLAKRYGVSRRTIRNWRKAAIDRRFVAATASA